jgi:ferredoxin
MLAFLARRRIPVTLLGGWHCAECSHGREGAAQLALNLEALALLRAASQDESWSSVDLAEISDQPFRPKGKGAFSAGRRQLFRRFVGRALDEAVEGADAGAAPPAPEKAIRAGAYFGTEQRELLQIVCERKDERPFRVKWHEALPLLQLSLKPGCTNCEACFRVCPTGALQIRENPGDWALIFHGDRCVACEVCMEVCQPRVLAAETEFDARPGQPERVLLSLCKQRCGRCDRFFVSPEPRPACGICEDDDDAFAAIFG